MVLEKAEITVRKGSEAEFGQAMRDKGLPILHALDGVSSVQFGQGVENPDKFMLLIEWNSIEAHNSATSLPVFQDFRALFVPHSIGGAMEHFQMD